MAGDTEKEKQHGIDSVPLILAGAASGGSHRAGHRKTCMLCLGAGHKVNSCPNTGQWMIPATKTKDAHVCGAAGATGDDVTAVDTTLTAA